MAKRKILCPCGAPHPPDASCTLHEGHPYYAWGYGLAPDVEIAWIVPCTTRAESEILKEFFFQVAGFLGAGADNGLPHFPRSYRLYPGPPRPMLYRWAPDLRTDALAWARDERNR